jgi:uncharacterized sporulation protein YeaH/YhbH (DUF444 family)
MALQSIIDRRLAGKNKSVGNRERFLRRHKEQVREAVKRAIDGRSIRDVERGEEVHIPKKDLSEPVFGHGSGGIREVVHPGNKDFIRGDRIERPKGGGGQGSGKGQASDSGEGEDDFTFALTKEEFMQVFFDDLALPHLIRTQLAETPEWKSHRAGFTSDGTPTNLHVVRSMRGAIGRRIAIGADARRELREGEAELEALLRDAPIGDAPSTQRITALRERLEFLRARIARIPFLDPIDLRFRNRVRVPVPTSKAVMFCLMDVSGSMDESRKDLAKRFFILLYLFLTRHYDKIDIVSSALVLMEEIIRARYSPSEWNIYGAQASDGDNWHHDSGRCRELLDQKILPLCRYYAYVQVAEEEQNLWTEYMQLLETQPHFAMRKAVEANQIYPVFRDLFKKESSAKAA